MIIGATNQDKVINEYNNFKRREYHWGDDPPQRCDVVRNINIHGHSLCGGQADQNVCDPRGHGLQRPLWVEFRATPSTTSTTTGSGTWLDTMMTMYVLRPIEPAQDRLAGPDRRRQDPHDRRGR